MSSDSEDDLDGFPLSYLQDLMLTLQWLPYQAGVGLPGRSPRAGYEPSFELLDRYDRPIDIILTSHVCREPLKTFISVNLNTVPDMLRGRLTTAVKVYMTYTRESREGEVLERTIDLVLSCPACMSQLCMVIARARDELAEDVHYKYHVPLKLGKLAVNSPFEAVLVRAATTGLPGFYSQVGGAAEFLYVNLDMCHCLLRPLYVSIFFSNWQMMNTLLRYGAEVRPDDTCYCEGPLRMHPLLRDYKILTGIYWPQIGSINTCWYKTGLDECISCQRLAALVMPCQDEELREVCYDLTKAYTPPVEFETLLREKGSLKHLCRITIRAAPLSRRALPKGVEQLPLPKLLQRYIFYQGGPGIP